MAPRRRTRGRPRAPSAPARPLPLPLQPGAAPPGNRRCDSGRYLPGPTPPAPLGELSLAEAQTRADYPPHSLLRTVWRNGVVSYDGMAITLGKRYAGALVRILEVGELVHLYLGEELIRVLAPDHTKRCQKLGKRRKRRL